jgi:hypothetical protein
MATSAKTKPYRVHPVPAKLPTLPGRVQHLVASHLLGIITVAKRPFTAEQLILSTPDASAAARPPASASLPTASPPQIALTPNPSYLSFVGGRARSPCPVEGIAYTGVFRLRTNRYNTASRHAIFPDPDFH